MASKVKKYARKCSVTGELMDEGWVWGDGEFYTKYESDTIRELRKDLDAYIDAWQTQDEYNEQLEIVSSMNDTTLLQWATDEEILYYTEWEEEEYQYAIDVHGNVISLIE